MLFPLPEMLNLPFKDYFYKAFPDEHEPSLKLLLHFCLQLFKKYILAHFSDTKIIVANFSSPLFACEILRAATLSCSSWSPPKPGLF